MKKTADEWSMKIGAGVMAALTIVMMATYLLDRDQQPDRGDLFFAAKIYCLSGALIYLGAHNAIRKSRARIAELEAAAAASRPQ